MYNIVRRKTAATSYNNTTCVIRVVFSEPITFICFGLGMLSLGNISNTWWSFGMLYDGGCVGLLSDDFMQLKCCENTCKDHDTVVATFEVLLVSGVPRPCCSFACLLLAFSSGKVVTDRQTNTHTVVTLNAEGCNVCLTQATAINRCRWRCSCVLCFYSWTLLCTR